LGHIILNVEYNQPMPFPDTRRVIYNKNPLNEVICQLRFPAILRIDSEIPVKYQERLRETYPIFSESQSSNLKLNITPELAQAIGSSLPLSFRGGRATYEFVSSDQKWKVILTRESLTLAASDYKKWEDFKEHFEIPLKAFVEEYTPPFFSRIGLRYQDVIQRSELQLTNIGWGELLESHIAGEFSSTAIANDIVRCVNQLTISLGENNGMVLLNHGLVPNQNNETCYLIDSDFFTENRTKVSDAIQKLDYFNKQAGRLFRWCITERLHDALEPQFIQ